MINQYQYDPYRSVPEINKGIYYNYTHAAANYSGTNQQIVPAQGNKWQSQFQLGNQQQQAAMAVHSYLERDSSHDSYYSNGNTVLPKLKPSLTPSPRKMLTSSFAENIAGNGGKTKSRSPQRIYKTHSDLHKDKSKKKGILKESEGSKSTRDLESHSSKKEIEGYSRKSESTSGDILQQILKKSQSIETNVMVVNHKLMMMESRIESMLANQKQLITRLEHFEKDVKLSSGLSPELLKEIKDALNIDFDIDLEIKPDEKINKYSINSIKAYKSNGNE